MKKKVNTPIFFNILPDFKGTLNEAALFSRIVSYQLHFGVESSFTHSVNQMSIETKVGRKAQDNILKKFTDSGWLVVNCQVLKNKNNCRSYLVIFRKLLGILDRYIEPGSQTYKDWELEIRAAGELQYKLNLVYNKLNNVFKAEIDQFNRIHEEDICPIVNLPATKGAYQAIKKWLESEEIKEINKRLMNNLMDHKEETERSNEEFIDEIFNNKIEGAFSYYCDCYISGHFSCKDLIVSFLYQDKEGNFPIVKSNLDWTEENNYANIYPIKLQIRSGVPDIIKSQIRCTKAKPIYYLDEYE